MLEKYIVKDENTVIGTIFDDYSFKPNPEYKGWIPPDLLANNLEATKRFLEDRVIQKDSQMVERRLKELGLPVWDPELIIEKSYGQLYDDHIWITSDNSIRYEDISIWNPKNLRPITGIDFSNIKPIK